MFLVGMHLQHLGRILPGVERASRRVDLPEVVGHEETLAGDAVSPNLEHGPLLVGGKHSAARRQGAASSGAAGSRASSSVLAAGPIRALFLALIARECQVATKELIP